jgi:hypothetical protein
MELADLERRRSRAPVDPRIIALARALAKRAARLDDAREATGSGPGRDEQRETTR